MTDAVLDVELLSKPTDWWVLRKTRLRALRDAPDAFASTYRIESAWPPGRWRDQFAAGTWVVGPVEAGDRTGLAGLLWPPTEAPHVEWVWVAASHRGRGMLRSLMEELAAAARSADARTLKLWVLKDNADALAAYRKLGFIETGEEQELRVAEADGKPRYEVRLRREL
jgi:ribosomal protein S18 acetylase RimI-like enzyme